MLEIVHHFPSWNVQLQNEISDKGLSPSYVTGESSGTLLQGEKNTIYEENVNVFGGGSDILIASNVCFFVLFKRAKCVGTFLQM